MTDEERQSGASASDSPLTRAFRRLADAADGPDAPYAAVRIVELAREFEGASDPPEGSEPPPPR